MAIRPQTNEAASHSVISFDFFFCSRMKDETDKLTGLVLSDRDTGLCLALPTLQKGGKILSYLVTEMCRFIVHCGHSEVGLRCDEPSTLALLEAVKRACMGLNMWCMQNLHLQATIKPMELQNRWLAL